MGRRLSRQVLLAVLRVQLANSQPRRGGYVWRAHKEPTASPLDLPSALLALSVVTLLQLVPLPLQSAYAVLRVPTEAVLVDLHATNAHLGRILLSQAQFPNRSVLSVVWAIFLLLLVQCLLLHVLGASLGPFPMLPGLLHAQSVHLVHTALPLDHPINSALPVQLVQITHQLDLHR